MGFRRSRSAMPRVDRLMMGDSLVFSPGVAPPVDPPPSVGSNEVSVQWGAILGEVQPYAYSVSAFQASSPTSTSALGYKALIDAMKAPMVRFHNDEILKESSTQYGLVDNPDAANFAWNTPKLVTMLTAPVYNGAAWCFTIPRWPSYCNISTTNKKLDPSKVNLFVDWCADLFVEASLAGAPIEHLLLLNELDHIYESSAAELSPIWLAAYDAIRAINPNVKIGGPGFISIWDPWAKTFLETDVNGRRVIDVIDFVSCHSYHSLNAQSTTKKASWLAATRMDGNSVKARSIINQLLPAPRRDVPVWLTESGPYYSNTEFVERKDSTRLIWESCLMASTALGAAQMVGSWCESDRWYGLNDNVGGAYARRPASYAYELFNSHLRGEVCASTVTGSSYTEQVGGNPVVVTDVLSFAVQSGGGDNLKRAIALINRCEQDRSVALMHQGWTSNGNGSLYRVSNSGLTSESLPTGTISLPANSIAVLVYN